MIVAGVLYINNDSILGHINDEKFPIVYADNYSRNIITDALKQINEQEGVNVTSYITDVYIVDDMKNSPCNLVDPGKILFGCEVPYTNLFGFENASIYVLDGNNKNYSQVCMTFGSVVYHEIGHTLYQIKYGIPRQEDDIYKKSLETYADGIAQKYVHIDKSKKVGCKEYYLAQEVERANRTLNIFREKMKDDEVSLENVNRDVENASRNMENANRNIEDAKVRMAQLNNELIAARNKLSAWSTFDKVFSRGAYQNDVSAYNSIANESNSAVDQYDSFVDPYNIAKDRYNSVVDQYNVVKDRYNSDLNEFNNVLNEYNRVVAMASVATSGD